MSYTIQVKHRYIIPENKIKRTIEHINKKIITYGVHAEDNNKHATRDRVQEGTLHRMLYANGEPIPPIGNAELLKKTEYGQENVAFYYGGVPHLVYVPPRPVLQPIAIMLLAFFRDIIENAIHKQFEFRNIYSFEQELNKFKLKFSRSVLYDFVRNRGEGFWEGGEHNSPYVQAVKFFDKLGEAGVQQIADVSKWGIKNITQWDATSVYHFGDTPLMDSLDLLNSIKAKLEDK